MDDIIKLLPEKWRLTALFALAIFPYITRGYYALVNGGGIVGMFRAVLWGTNTPKLNTDGKPTTPSAIDRMAGLFVAFALPVALAITLLLTGCAQRWIDKVSQGRIAATRIGHSAVGEFNVYYTLQTNQAPASKDLEAARGLVYETSTNLGLSTLQLEQLELDYKKAPTNQNQIMTVSKVVAANASNIVGLVNYIKKGNIK